MLLRKLAFKQMDTCEQFSNYSQSLEILKGPTDIGLQSFSEIDNSLGSCGRLPLICCCGVLEFDQRFWFRMLLCSLRVDSNIAPNSP